MQTAPHRTRSRVVVDVPSDDEVIEVDRNGRAVSRSRLQPQAQRFGLPVLPGQAAWNDTADQDRNATANLQILDPGPVLRRHYAHRSSSVLPGAHPTRNVGLGGAILSLGSTRGTRRIGFAAETRLRDPNDDGGRPPLRHHPIISRFLEAFMSGQPLLNFGRGAEEQDFGAVHQGNSPAFDRSFIHANKAPRPSFTYDFDTIPSRQLASPPTVQPASRFTNTISNLLSSKRKASAIVDLAADAEEAKVKEGSSQSLPTLVCAGCDKPLLLGGGGDDRIWGLRCGHLICGACLDRIGCPLPPKPRPLIVKLEEALSTEPTEVSRDDRRKSKGKARQMSPQRSPAYSPPFQNSLLDISSHPSGASASRYASLRPRRNMGASQSFDHRPTATSPEPPQATSSSSGALFGETGSQQTTGTTSNRGGRKRKGKGRAIKSTRPRVLREWDFACPVEGCHRLHTRVLVGTTLDDASWKPKGDAGEIAVYTS